MLNLTTPTQQFEPDANFELNPSALEKSLKEHQSAPMMDRISVLDAAITRFNEVKLETAKRIKLLEVYFTAYQKLLQGFDEMRIAQLNVSAQHKKQIKKDIMWLYIKLSHGYKIIVKDFASQVGNDKAPKDVILAAFRAIELSYMSLLYSYRFDIEEPPLCYLEINQLYAFAEHYNVQQTTVRAAQGYAKTPTIESFYVLCMIFTNLEPRQYESYTLEVLFLALQPLVFNCQVTSKIKFDPESHYYSVNLNKNQAAEILLDDKVTDISKTTRYICVDALIKELQDWLNKNQGNENSLLIEQELELFPAILTKLKISHKPKSPVHVEQPALQVESSEYQLVIGLPLLESLLIMDQLGISLNVGFNSSSWSKISETATTCELLSHANDYPEILALGELVAIVVQDTKEDGSLGRIRLNRIGQIIGLRQIEDQKLLMELEFIAGSAKPLTYRRLTCEDKTIDYTNAIGIYISNEENSEVAPLMVLPNKHFQPQQHYLIITRERSFSIEACELVKRSMMYSYFNYKVVQPNVSNPNIPQQTQKSATG